MARFPWSKISLFCGSSLQFVIKSDIISTRYYHFPSFLCFISDFAMRYQKKCFLRKTGCLIILWKSFAEIQQLFWDHYQKNSSDAVFNSDAAGLPGTVSAKKVLFNGHKESVRFLSFFDMLCKLVYSFEWAKKKWAFPSGAKWRK